MQHLKRDNERGIFCGVLAGLAEHYDEDPAIFRIVYCLLTLMTGFWIGLIGYFIMVMCIPAKEDTE